MRTHKSILPLAIVLTILLSGLVFTPVLGMPQADLSWRTATQAYDYQAYFYYYPSNPNFCNNVYFDGYTEPYVADATYSWQFGDGTKAVGQYVNHRYAADGDYLVTLTVTTPDGGLSSYSQTVQVRTQLQADFYYSPGDPSSYDVVYFWGYPYYGYEECSVAYAWDFGDGSTAKGQYVEHQFAQDGDYQVMFTVTINGSLTSSTTRTVEVRTHDVAITSFKVPQAAKAGQTRSITVSLDNKNYDERVRVWLYKSQPSYWQEIGSSLQSVPVRKGNRGTNFDFNYTFTAEDAAVGKVNFKAYASLESGRDALQTDNEAISDPTKVNR